MQSSEQSDRLTVLSKRPQTWIKHKHEPSWALCSSLSHQHERVHQLRKIYNLPSLDSFSLWGPFDEHVRVSWFLLIFPVLSEVCVCGQWQRMRWEIIYSLSKSLWLISSESPNISSAIKQRVVVEFSIITRWALIKRPIFFPICTYLTLLYTIEIYKYYKMSLFFTMSEHRHATWFQALFLLWS